VVIDDLDQFGAVTPHEANPPLIIDPDAVLPATVPSQRFEPIAGWRPQVAPTRLSDRSLTDPPLRSRCLGLTLIFQFFEPLPQIGVQPGSDCRERGKDYICS